MFDSNLIQNVFFYQTGGSLKILSQEVSFVKVPHTPRQALPPVPQPRAPAPPASRPRELGWVRRRRALRDLRAPPGLPRRHFALPRGEALLRAAPARPLRLLPRVARPPRPLRGGGRRRPRRAPLRAVPIRSDNQVAITTPRRRRRRCKCCIHCYPSSGPCWRHWGSWHGP
jgi:hypothetical protein